MGAGVLMSPLSNANLCRILIRPPGEWSRAGMRYHDSIARGSETFTGKHFVVDSVLRNIHPRKYRRTLTNFDYWSGEEVFN